VQVLARLILGDHEVLILPAGVRGATTDTWRMVDANRARRDSPSRGAVIGRCWRSTVDSRAAQSVEWFNVAC